VGQKTVQYVANVYTYCNAYPLIRDISDGPVTINNQGRGSSDIWEPLNQSQFRGML
jgi:hypothetical protein